jgi:hypothetical protein
MLNDRITAAKDVASALFALETAIDEALVCAAALTIALPAARTRARLSATVGHQATILTGEAMSALLEARSNAVAAHGSLADVRDELGLKTFASGDLWKLAPTKSETEKRLTIISSNAA